MSDIRWKQRFDNFLKAFETLKEAVALSQERNLTHLEQQGLIQGFEFTHELAWNVLKDYLENKGILGLIGSKDATRAAFKNGLLTKGDIWMAMIETRNKTTHTYQEETAQHAVDAILNQFFPEFQQFSIVFSNLQNQEDS